jgi:hypothetical protein
VNEDEIRKAAERAAEFCRNAEEYCPKGGLFFGDQFEANAPERAVGVGVSLADGLL